MPNITVSITDTQEKCLLTVMANTTDWAENLLHSRALNAQEDIIAKLVAHCNANDIAIATGVDAQVQQAYDLGVVDTAENIANAAPVNDLPDRTED